MIVTLFLASVLGVASSVVLWDVTIRARDTEHNELINVYITYTVKVGVNPPVPGSGTTEFDITGITDGANLTLTAPLTHQQTFDQEARFYEFRRWVIGGVNQPIGKNVVWFLVDDDTTVVARYRAVLEVNKTLLGCWKLISTFTVPAGGSTVSSPTLTNGVNYLFEAMGTYRYTTVSGSKYADAEFVGPSWTNPGALHDLYVNGGDVLWGQNYNPDHKYFYPFTGTGATVGFNIYDTNYGDGDSGSLTVKIWEACDPDAIPLNTIVLFKMNITVHAYQTVTDVTVMDGIGADLVLDTHSSYASVSHWKAGKGKMGATKVSWTIGGPTVCIDYELALYAYTGLNPRSKQEYTSTGDHDLNSGPIVYFTYDGTQYMLQGPPVTCLLYTSDAADE